MGDINGKDAKSKRESEIDKCRDPRRLEPETR